MDREGLVLKLVTAVAAVLVGIIGWPIITGRHDRYYKTAFRDPFYRKWLRPPDDVRPGPTDTKGAHHRRSLLLPRRGYMLVCQRFPEIVDPVRLAGGLDIVINCPYFRAGIGIFDHEEIIRGEAAALAC